MVKLGRKQYLGWKAETTAGTAIAIANANYHLVEDVNVEFAGDEHERTGNLGSLDSMKGVTGSVVATISFTTELKGSGADGSPFPDLDLWKAAGFECGESDYSGGSMVVEQASPSEMKTVSIRYFADGMQWDFKGCVGTFTLSCESGAIGKCNWTFTGMCDGMPSDGTNPTPSYNTTLPPVCQAATLTLDGGTAFGVCTKVDFDMGNEIANRRDMSETFGYTVPQITRRAGTGSMTVEVPTVSSYNWQTAWNNKNKIDGALTVGAGGSNHNTMAITWDMALNSSPSISDSDGILTYEIGFQLITDNLAGENTFAITYT